MRLAVLAGLVMGCGAGRTGDPGTELGLRVRGAQLVEAPMPEDGGGPAITLLQVPNPRVRRGAAAHPIAGRAGEGSFAIHLGVQGETTHWVLPVGLPDDVVATDRRWSVAFDLGWSAGPGTMTVLVAAADATGRAGPSASSVFELVEDDGAPLSVSLRWNRQVDLDLHVIGPDGVDINPKNINGYEPPPPGAPPDPPGAWMSGARLDHDSNAGCVIDGRRSETVRWPAAPPPGSYLVFADLFSACGEDAVSFTAEATLDGATIRRARGTLTAFDARRHPLGPGASPGRQLFAFEVTR